MKCDRICNSKPFRLMPRNSSNRLIGLEPASRNPWRRIISINGVSNMEIISSGSREGREGQTGRNSGRHAEAEQERERGRLVVNDDWDVRQIEGNLIGEFWRSQIDRLVGMTISSNQNDDIDSSEWRYRLIVCGACPHRSVVLVLRIMSPRIVNIERTASDWAAGQRVSCQVIRTTYGKRYAAMQVGGRERDRNKERDRQRQIDTERQRDRETERDRKKDRGWPLPSEGLIEAAEEAL